jgi:hypothetical protein
MYNLTIVITINGAGCGDRYGKGNSIAMGIKDIAKLAG